MALYGFNTNAQVPFTGWSPTLSASTTGSAAQGSAAGAVQFNGITQGDDRLVKELRKPGGRRLRQLMRVLLGAAPGGNATEVRYRVPARLGSPGGLVVAEAVTLLNRATTVNDDTQITALLDRVTKPPIYPVDLSGNGGAGKQKYMGVG